MGEATLHPDSWIKMFCTDFVLNHAFDAFENFYDFAALRDCRPYLAKELRGVFEVRAAMSAASNNR